jgi:hypothetical protein
LCFTSFLFSFFPGILRHSFSFLSFLLSHTEHSVRLPWTRDRPITETSNNTQAFMSPAGFQPTHNPGKRPDPDRRRIRPLGQ